jgi:hypothetical protein
MKHLAVRSLLASAAVAAATTLTPSAHAQLPGNDIKITAENLSFAYQSNDGRSDLACVHHLDNPDSQDWGVTCQDPKNAKNGTKRPFSVHLWVTRYDTVDGPKLEILYWITNGTTGESSSQTNWMHFDKDFSLKKLELSNGVDGDTAELRATITLTP